MSIISGDDWNSKGDKVWDLVVFEYDDFFYEENFDLLEEVNVVIC